MAGQKKNETYQKEAKVRDVCSGERCYSETSKEIIKVLSPTHQHVTLGKIGFRPQEPAETEIDRESIFSN